MTYMLPENPHIIAEEWRKYAGYTIRPLPSTIQYYTAIIEQLSPQAASLLYGATPEIRSVFQKCNLPLMMADRSAPMIHALGSLTLSQRAIAANEEFIQVDWLGVAEQLNRDYQFDFLIGDDAINMLRWRDFNLFLQNAAKLLKPRGEFICHLLIKPNDEQIQQDIFQLKQEYEQRKIKTNFDLASRLNFICYDYEDYSMGWQKTIAQLGREGLDLFKPHFDFYAMFAQCNSVFYCPEQIWFERLVTEQFMIADVFYPHEHDYCRFEPVYRLIKR